MKRAAAALVTAMTLAAVLVLGRRPPTNPATSQAEDTPTQCIERMFQAAERGDVAAYLDCFTAAERQRLDRQFNGQSPPDSAQALIRTVTMLRGWALLEAESDGTTGDETVLAVERVYSNHMERQRYRLVHGLAGWRIASIESVQAFQPQQAYGTHVSQQNNP